MEPVSFAIGSISAAATLFDSCIECLKYISAAQTRDRDYQILEIKFEFERERVYQLGKVMGLDVEATETTQLSATAIHDGQPLDSRTTKYLKLINSLIEDVERMRQRYGLREAPPSTDEETTAKPIGRIFRKLLKRSSRKKNKNNLSHPARWVIQDKEKFEKLIEDLKSLNDIFEDTVASHARLSTYRRELYKEIQTCADTDALEILSTAYMGDENGISDVASQQLSALEDRSSRMELLVTERMEYSNAQKTHPSPRPRQQSDQDLSTIKDFLESTKALDLEGYLDDQTRNAPFLSGSQSIALLEAMEATGSLIQSLRIDDLAHCKNVLARLSTRPRAINLERRMQLELKDLITTFSGAFDSILPTRGCSMAPIGDNVYEWRATIEGPIQTPYEGGIFHVRARVPAKYPMEPLHWNFETKIYHPNISRSTGEAIPGLLDRIYKNRPWCPDETFTCWLAILRELLVTPSPDPLHAIEPGVAEEFRKNRESFTRTAKEWTRIYANPELQGNVKPGSKFEVPAASRTVEEFESGLYNVRTTCSRLYTSVAGTDLHPSTEEGWLAGELATCLRSIISEIEYIQNSRFIDVIGGEEFTKYAQGHWLHISERIPLLVELTSKINSRSRNTGGSFPATTLVNDLRILTGRIVGCRESIENDISVQTYRECRFFLYAFLGAGFEDHEYQRSPTAKLPFPLFES